MTALQLISLSKWCQGDYDHWNANEEGSKKNCFFSRLEQAYEQDAPILKKLGQDLKLKCYTICSLDWPVPASAYGLFMRHETVIAKSVKKIETVFRDWNDAFV
eukprot:gene21710-8391_t